MNDEPSTDFMDLFVADQAMIYAFVRSLVPNFADAEEIFQQVAVTLWRKRETYDPALGTFRAWAIGIARNHIRNFNRHKLRDHRIQLFAPDIMERIAESWQARDEDFREQQAVLKLCIGKLDPSDRQRLERFYGGEMRAAEMAQTEGVPLRTFYRKLQKIRECLLNCMSKAMEAKGGVNGPY